MTSLLSSTVEVTGRTPLPPPGLESRSPVTSLLSSVVEVAKGMPLPPSEPTLVTPSSILSTEVTVTIRKAREAKPRRPWWILAILAGIGIIALASRRRRKEEKS